MKSKAIIATVLIALGLTAFYYQGIAYKNRQEALDLGPVPVSTKPTGTIPLQPIGGGIAVLSGLVLLFVGGPRQNRSGPHRDFSRWR